MNTEVEGRVVYRLERDARGCIYRELPLQIKWETIRSPAVSLYMQAIATYIKEIATDAQAIRIYIR